MTIESFEGLLGKTLTSVDKYDDEMVFTLDNGEKYKLWHCQDCCENVYIEDIVGSLDDLVGTPLTMAEEVDNVENEPPPDDYVPESYTWTFYKLATIKGYVTIRWFGTSNGYYSESVDFAKA
jgi:hypothetical protein